jgi:hypothetical protein
VEEPKYTEDFKNPLLILMVKSIMEISTVIDSGSKAQALLAAAARQNQDAQCESLNSFQWVDVSCCGGRGGPESVKVIVLSVSVVSCRTTFRC